MNSTWRCSEMHMRRQCKSKRLQCGALLVVLALGLTGCGGGGGSNSDTPAPTPPASEPDKWDSMDWDQGKWS